MNNKPLSPFAQYLIDTKDGLNKGQVQGRPGYITWEFVAKVILKRSVKTLYPWITGDATPHLVVQEKVKADFDRYIKRMNKRKTKKALK